MSKFDTFYAILGVIILGMLGYAYLLPQDEVYLCGSERYGLYYRLTHYVDGNYLTLESTDIRYADHEMKTLGITDASDVHIRAVDVDRLDVYVFNKTTYELTNTLNVLSTPIDVTFQCISDS